MNAFLESAFGPLAIFAVLLIVVAVAMRKWKIVLVLSALVLCMWFAVAQGWILIDP